MKLHHGVFANLQVYLMHLELLDLSLASVGVSTVGLLRVSSSSVARVPTRSIVRVASIARVCGIARVPTRLGTTLRSFSSSRTACITLSCIMH
jgi:hypothetical protein